MEATASIELATEPASAATSNDFVFIGIFPSRWKTAEMSLPDPWRHPRPIPAAHYTSLLADAPRRPLALFGPRQIGKTHFLTHDLHEAAQAKGWEPVYADLWGQSDTLDAVNTAVGAVLRRLASATGRTTVTSVGALGISVGMAAPAPLSAGTDPTAVLATQFAELVRLQPSKPVLLMLDEAQTLAKPGAGDLAMKAIRALFNSHPGSVLLVFTGSSKPQLMSLVGDHSKTAFKLAAHMDFPVLGQDFIRFVAQRHQAITQRPVDTAALGWAFEQLLHRPGEMIDFVRFMITETPGADVPTALEAFKAKHRPDLGFQQQFDACSPLQQALLLEVAGGHKLFSKDTRDRVGQRTAHPGAAAPATIHNGLAQLEAKGILTRSTQRGQCQFEDEHLREWVDKVARRRLAGPRG